MFYCYWGKENCSLFRGPLYIEVRAGAFSIFPATTAPFPGRVRLIFALVVLIRPHYTIREPSTGYSLTRSSKIHQDPKCLLIEYFFSIKDMVI